MTTYNDDGQMMSCFIAPRISYEEMCERAGAAFNDEQKSARKALHDLLSAPGYQYDRDAERPLHKAIEEADRKRFEELRAQGWEWPHQKERDDDT